MFRSSRSIKMIKTTTFGLVSTIYILDVDGVDLMIACNICSSSVHLVLKPANGCAHLQMAACVVERKYLANFY